jgi:hypothetical protein
METGSYTFPIANSAKYCQKHIIAAIRKLETMAKSEGYFGFSECRICKCHNGSAEYTHGKYTWPSGYIHYLEKHNVQADPEFAKYALDYTIMTTQFSENNNTTKKIMNHV